MNKVSNTPSQPGRIKAVFGAQCQWLWLGHCTGAEHDGGAGSWQAVVGVGIDPDVTQAVSAASGVGYEKSAMAGNNPAPPPAPGSSSAGTSLEANLKHVTVTLATWDVVWEVYLDLKWARQRLRLERLFEKLEEEMEEVSMKRHKRVKQLVVSIGAVGTCTRVGWGADAVLRACCKVACRPRGTDQQRGREVLVVEFCTSRVSSAVNGRQAYENMLMKRRHTSLQAGSPQQGSPHAARQPHSQQPEPEPSAPPLAKRSKRTMVVQAAEPTQPNKGTGKGKGNAAKAKPKPQPGNWLDRDCNAALTMQRIGESRWRPLELCWWRDQAALPAKGREYPGLGYKQLQDKPPKASSSN
ncbi:hypothetical protein QJQ45_001005 [Haematococcus lacustris]|nr:hypothetical protein QJQ45_001005 [Haematococcus lacustris]